MTVLFAATEAESFDFTNIVDLVITTDNTRFNSSYSRCGLRPDFRCEMKANLPSPVTELWLHFSSWISLAGASSHDEPWIEFRDSANDQVLFHLDGDNGFYNIEWWNGSSFVEGPAFLQSQNVVIDFDIHIKINDTAGIFRVYIDGVLAAEYTGDTNFISGAAIDQIIFSSVSHSSGTNATHTFSEIIVADEPTIGWHLATLAPDGNGATTDFTGDVTDIDDLGLADTSDVIFSDTADETSTFTLDNTTLPVNFEVKAVAVGGFFRHGTSGPQNAELVVRTNSTDFGSGDVNNNVVSGVDTGWRGFNYVWETNPDTATTWTESDVNALEAGVKSKA